MTRHTSPGPDPETATRSSTPGARRATLVGAWMSGVALPVLVGAIVALLVDSRTPPPPVEEKIEVTLNGRTVSGETAGEVVREVGAHLLEAISNKGDADSSTDVPGAARERASLHLELDSTSPTERLAHWLLLAFVPLAILGSILGWIGHRRGVRGPVVWIALWPIGLLIGLGTALPSCSM